MAGDADPSPALGNLPGSVRHRSRITSPVVRRGWLDDGPGPTARRGADDFVAVSWDELTELLAARRFRDRGGRIVSFSPLRDDVDGPCDRYAAVPGTDVAIMLALAYVLATESLAERDFLATHCTGYEHFERYLPGTDDGVPKSPQWAAPICGLPADELTALARRMATARTIVTVSWSLQRTRQGEQAPWMGLTLAAMLGQIGLPGGGSATDTAR